ncbi:hypothetical protein PAXRUDRAFT_694963 [Paxillus rubicundulus Ve08.2h10]|uniref:Uncharacterized protein n=1 Tax=Paxillus rubicundulus Ve08.2h10 TaxID=930991 RepID=A0A0D0E2R8_9AGAM|nr:hypothetical protein PAXRUDRAFT_694963 [Paxillus rubicundulus Ve08.2h10]
MQARSSCQPTPFATSYNHPNRRRSYPLQFVGLTPRPQLPSLVPARSTSPPTPSSPLARYSTTSSTDTDSGRATRKSNEQRRKSFCELIPEELVGLSSDLSATLHNHIDLSLELLKRHHKPRSSLIRTTSDPQILSTNSTQPVHIHQSQ